MASRKRDVADLIEFSLLHHFEHAVKKFPMFSKQQIAALYAMTYEERQKLLEERSSVETCGSMIRPIPDHRTPAQAKKSAEQATDPSNR